MCNWGTNKNTEMLDPPLFLIHSPRGVSGSGRYFQKQMQNGNPQTYINPITVIFIHYSLCFNKLDQGFKKVSEEENACSELKNNNLLVTGIEVSILTYQHLKKF